MQSVAYKNAVGSRRASWRIISSVEQKEKSKGAVENVARCEAYRTKVEAELNNICNTVLQLIGTQHTHTTQHTCLSVCLSVCECTRVSCVCVRCRRVPHPDLTIGSTHTPTNRDREGGEAVMCHRACLVSILPPSLLVPSCMYAG